jgi:chemotaxis protein methyltransferase CheR
VAARLGLELPDRRRDELARALTEAAEAADGAALGRYLARLRVVPHDAPEWRRLVRRLTVRESYFFRDRALFEALARDLLPALIARRRREGVLRLRLWSAGCAAGQEPYSLAILLDRALPDRADWSLTILGTDLDVAALQAAADATYTAWALRATPAWALEYFERRGNRFELAREIRELVDFAPLNLAGDTYPSLSTGTGAMDLILCRNVLMYFTESARRATVGRLQRALVHGGWLAVSPVEASAQLLHPLTAVGFAGCVLHRKDARPAATEQPPPTRPRATRPVTATRAPRVAAKRDPVPDAATLVMSARAEADRGRLERAGELCRAALRADKLQPDAHLLLAAIHQERGDAEAALAALRAAVYVAPDSPAAHFSLGALLLRRGATAQGRLSMRSAAALLADLAPDEPVPGGDGVTAGGLLATARAYLELAS